MHRSYEEILNSIEDVADVLRGSGGRVTVTCSGGARIHGSWIELGSSRRAQPSLTLFAETADGMSSTRIDLQEVVAVGVDTDQSGDHHDQRVLPSQYEMTLAAILIEAWGRTERVTYGMVLEALDGIDGSGAQHVADGWNEAPLDRVDPAMLPLAEKVLLHLADRDMPKRIMDMRMLAIDHDPALKDELGDMIRNLFAEKGESFMTGSIGDLPEAFRRDIGGRVRLATARFEARRAYHPFIERARWAAIAAAL